MSAGAYHPIAPLSLHTVVSSGEGRGKLSATFSAHCPLLLLHTIRYYHPAERVGVCACVRHVQPTYVLTYLLTYLLTYYLLKC